MILRITFNDNDFTQYIEKFLDKHYSNLWGLLSSVLDKYDDEEYIEEYVKKSREINHFTTTFNSLDKVSKKEENTLIDLFKQAITYYLETHFEDSSYLLDNLSITVVKSVQDKWENGEVVYYFTTHGKYITM